MKTDQNKLSIRKMDSSDVHYVLEVENNPAVWEVSDADSKYELADIEKLVLDLKDVKVAKQTRYIIQLDETRIGTIDLTDINFEKKEASIGILISDLNSRRKGYAQKALVMIEEVADSLGIVCLNAIVHLDNEPSNHLFVKAGYQKKMAPPPSELDNAEYINVEHYIKWLKK